MPLIAASSLQTLSVDDVDVSEVYLDDRDGNSARPYCVRVSIPEPNPRPTARAKYRHVLRIRSGRQDHAEQIFNFLCDELEGVNGPVPTVQQFVGMVLEIQSGTNVMARRASANAHVTTTAS